MLVAAIEVTSFAAAPPSDPSLATLARAETAAGQGVASYELYAELDAETHRIRGKGVIRWRNASSVPQRELWLHAYLNAFKDERTRLMRRGEPDGFRGGTSLGHHGSLEVHRLRARELDAELWGGVTYGEEDDETDVRVPLPREVAPGESLTLDVEFTASLPSVMLRTGYADRFHMVAQWFPKLARLEPDGRWAHFSLDRFSEFYADFGDYDVTIDVPEAFLVGATGAPVGDLSEGGRRRVRFIAPRVHEFAFAAWDGFEEVRQLAGGVELVALFPKGEGEEADLELDVATRALAHFAERYGPYPYRRLTLVRPPREAAEAGGMEYPTLITTGASTRFRAVGLRSIEAITVHELAHQWFYGRLATHEHRYPYLDEGLTSYAELEVMERFWPGNSGFDGFGFRVSEEAAYRIAAADAEGRGRVDRASSEFADGHAYGGLVYARMATTLRTLARVYGEERMQRALGVYARVHRFSHPRPMDLVAAVKAEVGEAAAVALTAAVEGGSVDVRLDGWESHRDAGGGFVGTVSLRREGAVVLPVEVDVRSARGSVTRLRWDGVGEQVILPWRGDAPMASVLVDPDDRILLDARLEGRASGGPKATPRVWALAACLAQLGASIVWP